MSVLKNIENSLSGKLVRSALGSKPFWDFLIILFSKHLNHLASATTSQLNRVLAYAKVITIFLIFFQQRSHLHYNNYGAGVTPESYKITLQVGQRKFLGEGHTLQAARHDAASRALDVLKPITQDSAAGDISSTNIEDTNSDLKSPISLIHEMALKRNLSVQFEVRSEKGPPHMKTFITLCIVGTIAVSRTFFLLFF